MIIHVCSQYPKIAFLMEKKCAKTLDVGGTYSLTKTRDALRFADPFCLNLVR